MPRYNADTAIIGAEITQLIADWGSDLDHNNCEGVPALCIPDCDYYVGGKLHKGRAAIAAFYAARNERVRTQQRDGVRTQRHTITNHQLTFPGSGRAAATFLLVNYSAEGKAPALNLVGPTIIADCRMEFQREAAYYPR